MEKELRTIRVKKLGVDYWGREVYQNIENKNIYKLIDNSLYENKWYFTSDSFDGEPDCPLKRELNIIVVE